MAEITKTWQGNFTMKAHLRLFADPSEPSVCVFHRQAKSKMAVVPASGASVPCIAETGCAQLSIRLRSAVHSTLSPGSGALVQGL